METNNDLNNRESWEQYYDQHDKSISVERIESVKQIHRVFLDVLLQQGKSIATEVGIGTGTMGFTLSCLAKEQAITLNVYELDYSIKFLKAAKDFNGSSSINYVQADTFTLPFSAVHRNNHMIFHQGLLEHFSNEEIQQMLIEQLRVADTVIATVPSYEYVFQAGLRGDERLMSLEQWTDIIQPIAQITGFYYGLNSDERFHICLIIRK